MRLVRFVTTNGEAWINPEHVISVERTTSREDITQIFTYAVPVVVVGSTPVNGSAVSWHTKESAESVVARLEGSEEVPYARG